MFETLQWATYIENTREAVKMNHNHCRLRCFLDKILFDDDFMLFVGFGFQRIPSIFLLFEELKSFRKYTKTKNDLHYCLNNAR